MTDQEIRQARVRNGADPDAATDPRPLYEIALEILTSWEKPYFGAVPYLTAMASMDSVDSKFGVEDGDMIVRYFLVNAQTWRGETARRVKAELKAMLK
jgi:hypothetical protein